MTPAGAARLPRASGLRACLPSSLKCGGRGCALSAAPFDGCARPALLPAMCCKPPVIVARLLQETRLGCCPVAAAPQVRLFSVLPPSTQNEMIRSGHFQGTYSTHPEACGGGAGGWEPACAASQGCSLAEQVEASAARPFSRTCPCSGHRWRPCALSWSATRLAQRLPPKTVPFRGHALPLPCRRRRTLRSWSAASSCCGTARSALLGWG